MEEIVNHVLRRDKVDANNLKNLFDALYNRMILRDFFGKVIPGLIFLSTVFMCFWWEYAELLKLINLIKDLSFLAWLVIFGAAWLTAFGIQGFGELIGRIKSIGVIRYYPRDVFNDDDKSWFKFREKFLKNANQEQNVEAERFVVIKEACGNGCIGIGISFIFTLFFEFFYGHITWQILQDSWCIWFPIVVLIWFLIIFLGVMHRKHVQRQYDYMKQVAGEDC